MPTKVLVAGAGGFIGGYLVKRLIHEGHSVIAVDCKPLNTWLQLSSSAHNVQADLQDRQNAQEVTEGVHTVFHLAAEMGGIGFISRHNWACAQSSIITQVLLEASVAAGVRQFFFASSACVYPRHLQTPEGTPLHENLAFPADPENGYGWAKLFSEQLCTYVRSEFPLDIQVGRLFNVYGPRCDTTDIRGKAPGVLCRRVAVAQRARRHRVEVWGDGTARRSFLYIDDCIDAILMLVGSGLGVPVNIASDEMVSISELLALVGDAASWDVSAVSVDGPQGVANRVPDLSRANDVLGWHPQVALAEGISRTYASVSRELDTIITVAD